MDPRIRKQAEILINHSTDIQKGDHVVVSSPTAGEDLVQALCEKIGEKGATVTSLMTGDNLKRAYLLSTQTDEIIEPTAAKSLFDDADAIINIRAEMNMTELSDVPPEKLSQYNRVREDMQEIRLSKKWCVTQHPTEPKANIANMYIDDYRDFVYDAINQDWEAQRKFQENLVEILNPANEVRIVSGDTTDIEMNISGNIAINDYGEHNMPGGEVFTAPVIDSVEGTVLFDKPLYIKGTGRKVKNIELEFESGEVVNYSVDSNEETFEELLNTDSGARKLGELGIGMNRNIDTFTCNMPLDEKMGDTVHLALGRAYEDTVGEGNQRNQSVVHQDMIVDMSSDSYIEVDGERIQEDGKFIFE